MEEKEVEKRICKYCNRELVITEFYSTLYNGKMYRRHRCKLCKQSIQNDRKKSIKKWLEDVKSKLKCVKCGESDFRTLDFHHRDGSTKEVDIGRVIGIGWSVKRIKKEIDKCDVLCCKCHRILHWELNHPDDKLQ